MVAVELGPWVEVNRIARRGERAVVVAVNRRDGQAAYLSEDDDRLLGGLRGASINLRELSPSERTLIDSLYEAGFLTSRPETLESVRRARDVAADFVATLDASWSGAHNLTLALYRAGVRHLFRPTAIAFQAVVALAGVVAVVVTLQSGNTWELRAEPWQIPLIMAIDLFAVFCHELGHAVVIVRHGRRVRSAGFRLHLGTPAFYVDSVEALLLPRKERAIQVLAGPWAEWLVTSLCAIAIVAAGDRLGIATVILSRFVVLNSLTVATNLLPFVGLDGHLLLSDVLGMPDLAIRSRAAVGEVWRGERSRGQFALAAYAATNAAVAIVLLATAGFFWYQLFGALISRLVGIGALGVVALVTLVLLLARPAFQPVLESRLHVRQRLSVVMANVRFRLQRRWRVESVLCLRTLQPFGDLDAGELGVLAGQLERVHFASDHEVDLSRWSAIYIRRGLMDATGLRISRGDAFTSPSGRVLVRCRGRVDLVVVPSGAASSAAIDPS